MRWLLCTAVVALLACPAAADADVFGPIALASGGTLAGGEPQQAEYAHDPAVSGDGRYIAFDGSFGGVTGVWRAELRKGSSGHLLTGRVEQVAGGDADLPSISADGRYVSFTTNEGASLAEVTDGRLDAHPKQEPVNVYVRDMNVAIPASGRCEAQQPCPFAVASAPSGSAQPLTYAGTATTLGSVAVGRSAISANGQEVAFVTTAVSNLVKTEKDRIAEAKGEAPPPETPALQVAVRYLNDDTTKLVSGRYEPATGGTGEAPVSTVEGGTKQYGAVYAGTALGFNPPPAYGKYAGPPVGASLSADGSTVAWMGDDIGEQAPLLPGEAREPRYTEPLWRRIKPGAETPTERVTGGSDPQNPACVSSGESALPERPSPSDPCQGPFATGSEAPQPPGIAAGVTASEIVPRLSADGYTVAFVARAPLVALSEYFSISAAVPADLYVANMHLGLTRTQALTQLTQIVSVETAGGGEIYDFDISPDGEQVAFTTMRTQFPLGSPAYITAPLPEPGMEELFDADVHDHTLTRVTRSFTGGPSEHPHALRSVGVDPYQQGDGALSPSFSTSGEILAFSSTASNLVWGDGNTPSLSEESPTADGSDAFAVERIGFSALPAPQLISPAPADLPLMPAWSLGVTARSRPDGSVVLYVRTPGAGTLSALAHGAVPLRLAARPARRAHRLTRARARPRGGARLGPAARRRAPARGTVAVRTIAATSARVEAEAAEPVAMTLRPAGPYLPLASEHGGLSASVSLTFRAAGHPTLHESVTVVFLRARPPRGAAGRSARHPLRGGHRR